MIKFGNSTIKECNFNNINISCYEKHTCESISYNNKIITDNEAEKEFKICSQKEVNEILNKINNNKSSSFTILRYIIVGVVVILISVLIIFIFIEKNKSKKQKFDEFRSGSIYIKLNNRNNNKNNNINDNNEINNSNNTNIEINNSSNANIEVNKRNIVNIDIEKNKNFIFVIDNKNNDCDDEKMNMINEKMNTLDEKINLINEKESKKFNKKEYDDLKQDDINIMKKLKKN